MEHKRLSSLIGLCILVTTSQYVLTTQGSDTNECCVREERKDIIELITAANATNETECTRLCTGRRDCFGVSWVSNISANRYDECILYASLKQIKHWKLINCADASRTYCWKVKTDVHLSGGSQQNISDEDLCKSICVNNLTCYAVVWNINKTQCWWILKSNKYSTLKEIKEPVNYWTIVRDISRNFQNSKREWEANGGSNSTTSDISVAVALSVLLGACALFIVGLSIYAVKLKKRMPTTICSAPKVVEVKVTEEVKEIDEEKQDDDESYIDYQDLRKIDNGNTYEEACEYTAMELEEMKLRKDDDDVYCNEDQ